MPTDDVTTAAPPQLSPDGHWWWDGTAWIPAAERPGAPIAVAATSVPMASEPVASEPVAERPVAAVPSVEQPPVEMFVEQPAFEQPVAPSWAAAPMPGNAIPHQPFSPQPFAGQPFVAQPYAPGYSLAAAQSPGKTLGIVSLVLSLAWMGGLGSIAAIITGHMSRSKDRKAGAPQSGLALAGLILGYLGLAFIPLMAAIAIPVFLDQRAQAQSAGLASELRSAAVVQETLFTDYGSYATSAAELAGGGYSGDPSIRLEVLAVDAVSYCLGAVAPEVGDALYYDSATGTVSPTPCY